MQTKPGILFHRVVSYQELICERCKTGKVCQKKLLTQIRQQVKLKPKREPKDHAEVARRFHLSNFALLQMIASSIFGTIPLLLHSDNKCKWAALGIAIAVSIPGETTQHLSKKNSSIFFYTMSCWKPFQFSMLRHLFSIVDRRFSFTGHCLGKKW